MSEQSLPKDTADFYKQQSKESNPGKHINMYSNLPNEIDGLFRVVHGLIAHHDDTQDMYGFAVPESRILEANTRYMEDILTKLKQMDSSPLTQEREPQNRFLGSCRDFALTLCSLLRHNGTPARLRVGFAGYFRPGRYSDHWVTEYWNEEKQSWILVDAELGEKEIEKYGITFDPTNVPRDQFLPGGVVWKMTKNGRKDPSLFGVHKVPVNGLWFIRADTLRDLASLNKVELLPWDYTEFFDKQFIQLSELPSDEIELIDEIADVTSNPDFDVKTIQNLYQSNSQLQVSGTIRSYLTEDPIQVQLRN